MKESLFSKTNLCLFGFCTVLLIVGYILLGQGPGPENPLSKSVAPVVLVAVYCGLVPFAILYGYKKDGSGKETGTKPK